MNSSDDHTKSNLLYFSYRHSANTNKFSIILKLRDKEFVQFFVLYWNKYTIFEYETTNDYFTLCKSLLNQCNSLEDMPKKLNQNTELLPNNAQKHTQIQLWI